MKKLFLISILFTVLISGLNYTLAQNVKRTLKQAGFTTSIIKPLGDSPKSMIALYDSIYQWYWDTTNLGFER